MSRPIRFRADYARWPRALPRDGVRLRPASDTADRLIGWGCAVGLLIAVLLIAGGVL